ncbi:MAG: hypothetical protein WAX77_07985 [Methylococcaceae bacterium]
MVTVGFIVEGASDKKLVESQSFQDWLQQDFNLKVIKTIEVGGNGKMCSRKIKEYVDILKKLKPDRIVVLADLDPEKCAPCITKRKEIIGTENIDLVVIARKAIESWFLADTQAMRNWTKCSDFFEPNPELELTHEMPWDRLRTISQEKYNRGLGCKVTFARTFIHKNNFSISRAAEHPNCPSAKYFVDKLKSL